MTKDECAIVTAYTGYSMLIGDDLGIFYKYVEEKMGRPIPTHLFAFEETWTELHEKVKTDFIKLGEEAT